MDASTGAKPNGNGHADPDPVVLPSAAAAPSGAPVPGAIAAPAAGALDVARDPVTGKILPGRSLNPKGRPPGIPNKNAEFQKILKSGELREVWKIAKTQAKAGKTGLLEFLLDRALVRLTPEAGGTTVNVNQTHQQTTVLQNLDARLEKFADGLRNPAARERLAAYLDELDRGNGVAGENGHDGH